MSELKDRLLEALSIREMTAAELSRKSGIDKGSISNYLKGKFIPKQNAIYLMAKALDVSPAWLLGYELTIDGKDIETPIESVIKAKQSEIDINKLTEVQQQLIVEVMKLSPDNQFKMSNFMKFLLFEQGLDENGYPIEDSQEEDKK